MVGVGPFVEVHILDAMVHHAMEVRGKGRRNALVVDQLVWNRGYTADKEDIVDTVHKDPVVHHIVVDSMETLLRNPKII